MAKRKRDISDDRQQSSTVPPRARTKPVQTKAHLTPSPSSSIDDRVCIQIVTGSYDRVLHGLTATVDLSHNFGDGGDNESQDFVHFADTFLFNAHASSVRCLAFSPLPSASGIDGASTNVILASGGSDERINLYSVSAIAPKPGFGSKLISSSVGSVAKSEDSKNREIGSLLHHSSAVTKLRFATRSKLLSGSEDNTVAISRSRDWTVLSTMKAPTPQAHGRPSGDTAAAGKTPAGINDFDIDPSMRVMITVGKGERCMRLWNLVTGKKAGALNFGKELLQAIGEDRSFSGEGRHVVFKPNGEGFVIAFERAAVVFDMQSKIQGIVQPQPKTKLLQLRFVPQENLDILCVSTEDGRVVFFDTRKADSTSVGALESKFEYYSPKGHIGGPAAGVASRVKDFEILPLGGRPSQFINITAGSDGSIRLWHIELNSFVDEESQTKRTIHGAARTSNGEKALSSDQIGSLLGRFESTNRITCLKAFVMLPSKVVSNVERGQTSALQAPGSSGDDEEFRGFE